MIPQRVPFIRQRSYDRPTRPPTFRSVTTPTMRSDYEKISSSPAPDGESGRLPTTTRKQLANLRLWQAATVTLGILVLVMAAMFLSAANRAPPKLQTDLLTVPHSQNIKMTRYDWGLHAQANGTLRATVDSSHPSYVGNPSPGIDAAWEALIGNRYFKLNDAEVHWLNQDHAVQTIEPLPYWREAVREPGFYGGIDMMHSLHCVNSLRKHLDRDYYADDEMLLLPGEDVRLHLNHCLEQLRQAVLCHGDATPVTLRPVVTELNDGRRVLTMLGETERLHTCKDYESILRWVREQAAERGHL